MREKISYFNAVQIIGNILMIIVLIFLFITKEKITYDLYWLLTTIMVIGNTLFIGKWGRQGQLFDNRKSKEIARSLDDMTGAMFILYVLIYLAVFFIQDVNVALRTNEYLIIGLYSLTVICQLFMGLAVDKAYKDTKKLIQSSKVKK